MYFRQITSFVLRNGACSIIAMQRRALDGGSCLVWAALVAIGAVEFGTGVGLYLAYMQLCLAKVRLPLAYMPTARSDACAYGWGLQD